MEKEVIYRVSLDKLERIKRSSTSTSSSFDMPDQVVGSTNLYDENGEIRLIPAPTPDPKDPLNLPQWRKVVAIVAVAFFGALAISAEAIIGALVPVFALEYAGVNPKLLDQLEISKLGTPGVVNLNPLAILGSLGGPPLWKISLISSLPLLTNGISSYLLVPLSIGVGRRPVLLFCGLFAWTGGLWAGLSRGLDSHLAARCFMGIGAGAVEALIPLMVQDLVFIHQRNRAMSAIWAAQGFIIVGLGIGSPVIVVTLGWRSVYFITAGISVIAWIAIIFFVPETRWMRSQGELAGKSVHYIYPGERRARQDPATYGRRTTRTDLGLFNYGFEWKACGKSMIDTFRTLLFPTILWAVAVDSIFISLQVAAAQTGTSVLIAKGWKFRLLGLAVLPIVVATPMVWFYGGFIADKISNFVARRRGGKREPEAHLFTLILPLLMGIGGSILFGYAGQHVQTHWIVLLSAIFLISMSFLATNTIIAVYAVESYPQWAGPVLVNVSSLRCVIGFAMSFRATTWVETRGFMGSFAIYASVLGVLTCLLPFMYIFGKPIRRWTAGTVKPSSSELVATKY